MKKLSFFLLLTAIIGNLNALNLQSYQFIDLLLSLKKPVQPFVYEDAVIFTASALRFRKAGVAFAHEDFAKTYWFKKIMVPIDQTEPYNESAKKEPERLRDSGLLFYAYEVPAGLTRLEYRLVSDGLWGIDPLNPAQYTDLNSGLELSIAPVPPRTEKNQVADKKGILRIRYKAASGDTVTLAGDFNGWDPFMYQLNEIQAGEYSLELPLPAGTYRYILYHNGTEALDPDNTSKMYGAGAKVVNTVQIR